MNLAALPIAGLHALEENYDSALRRVRQAISRSQDQCPHVATVGIPPADDFDVRGRQCTACRKFLYR